MLRYLNASYQFAERVSCLAHHYSFVTRELNHAALREIYFGPGVCLAEFSGRSGSQYRLILSTYTIPHSEGELLLKLTTSNGEIISMVIFSVGVDGDGCSRIEVGAIQGARRQHPELSKAASRDFYSMHPLRLLIAMLYGFARTYKIEKIVCVGTTNQVGYSEDPSSHFRTDYDHLWLELGGMPARPGFYELPQEMLHGGQADRNSHGRRSRRRSELKRTIIEALEQTLRAFRL